MKNRRGGEYLRQKDRRTGEREAASSWRRHKEWEERGRGEGKWEWRMKSCELKIKNGG